MICSKTLEKIQAVAVPVSALAGVFGSATLITKVVSKMPLPLPVKIIAPVVAEMSVGIAAGELVDKGMQKAIDKARRHEASDEQNLAQRIKDGNVRVVKITKVDPEVKAFEAFEAAIKAKEELAAYKLRVANEEERMAAESKKRKELLKAFDDFKAA